MTAKELGEAKGRTRSSKRAGRTESHAIEGDEIDHHLLRFIDTDTDTDPESATDTDPDSETETDTDSETETETETDSETDSDSDSDSQPFSLLLNPPPPLPPWISKREQSEERPNEAGQETKLRSVSLW